MKKLHTVIIGAGHSGLSVSYFLAQKGIEHVVLEKGKIGETWRSRTWDSLRMVLPNWMTQLPGYNYNGPKPHAFDSKQEYIQYLQEYAKSFNAPIQTDATVISLAKENGEFLLQTSKGEFHAKNEVVA